MGNWGADAMTLGLTSNGGEPRGPALTTQIVDTWDSASAQYDGGPSSVVRLGTHPSRNCSGDPLRGPPSEHEPTAASRSAVDPPPKMSAPTDDYTTTAHALVAYPLRRHR